MWVSRVVKRVLEDERQARARGMAAARVEMTTC